MKRISMKMFVIGGIIVALLLALVVAPYASSQPDGLERVAADTGIDAGVEDHALADGPLADYAVTGVDNGFISTGLAGLVGVLLTFAIGIGLFAVMRVAKRR